MPDPTGCKRLQNTDPAAHIRDGQAAGTWQPRTSISTWIAHYPGAHWCGNFCRSDAELACAVFIIDSTAVGLVGLYLATRNSEHRDVDQHDLVVDA